jgi:Zn-finger nucleic acid-binding protein
MEAQKEFYGNSDARVSCPTCYRLMFKQCLPVPHLELQLDVCDRCDVVWLDPGEVALLQLVYEATDWHQDSLEHQRRMLEVLRSPERLARLERAIRHAEGPAPLPVQALEQALDTLLLLILRTGEHRLGPRDA